MQSVLFFSDKQVREVLFARVDGTRGLLLVTGVRHGPAMRTPEAREPFATLERLHGDVLSQVLVADEGTTEGMWRDPLGDLGDRLYPSSRDDAYAASTGYLLLENGRPRAVVRKHGTPAEDLWFLQEALSKLTPRVPAPDPEKRPGYKKPEPPPRRPADSGAPEEEVAWDGEARRPGTRDAGTRSTGAGGQSRSSAGARETGARDRSRSSAWAREKGAGDRGREWAGARDADTRGPGARDAGAHAWDDEATPPRGTRVPPPPPKPPPVKDAWTVLGISRATPLDEARKAFRALITQYHPDKVAHLAPEFHELAERRTREILEAWDAVERALSGSSGEG
ncbi:DnaJ domain-containing protein [Pyxidicoccus parkwayensis]|uniref:DnaJ domain-containing protein n=1 Tax=Pyxidicoccus parkwayensis TaxID=2813578 RepID=A0ABX7NQD6_9BACT|nr:J domain-containing protein [Pyxidicoccus parkwaysis]QSQ20653.1 DnaJ domain-containing protein [Pyxidicoccus parkwaysis]